MCLDCFGHIVLNAVARLATVFAQFKSKDECWFLLQLKRKGFEVTHNFFQSCHGKGPSDSEGAMVKTGLRAAEDRPSYFADTVAAFKYLESSLCIERGSVSVVGKHRHTIGSRKYILIRVRCLLAVFSLSEFVTRLIRDGDAKHRLATSITMRSPKSPTCRKS